MPLQHNLDHSSKLNRAILYRHRLIKASEERVTDDHPWTLVTFCVEVPEGAKEAAARLGQESARMLRLLPNGAELRWAVGAMSKFDTPGRTPQPFFITWDDPQFRPDKVRRQILLSEHLVTL